MFNFSKKKTAIVIPARFASTRLPGKPLLKVQDKPIIQWVYERSCQSKYADMVIVATDDERIYEEVKSFGGNAEMTSPDHQSGSDRIAEVINKFPEIDKIVNVQGDEPLIEPSSIDLAIKCLEDKKADIATLIRPIDDIQEVQNPNLVKAVVDNEGFALYFSRSPVPFARKEEEAKYFGHLGLYAYKRKSLFKMTSLEQTSLEKAECLEQLRALENGLKIKTAVVNYKPIGIDTREDLIEFIKLVDEKSVISY